MTDAIGIPRTVPDAAFRGRIAAARDNGRKAKLAGAPVRSPYNRASLFFGNVRGAMNGSQPTYEFGPFALDADKRLLLRDGVPVPLAPKALETLLALIEYRDRVVSKDELLQRIWGDTVVEEGGLTRNISILRKALGEKPDEHQYTVTVPDGDISSSRMCTSGREAHNRSTLKVKPRPGRVSTGGCPVGPPRVGRRFS